MGKPLAMVKVRLYEAEADLEDVKRRTSFREGPRNVSVFGGYHLGPKRGQGESSSRGTISTSMKDSITNNNNNNDNKSSDDDAVDDDDDIKVK